MYQPLGPWTAPSLQEWTWFKLANGEVLFYNSDQDEWQVYTPVMALGRWTWQS